MKRSVITLSIIPALFTLLTCKSPQAVIPSDVVMETHENLLQRVLREDKHGIRNREAAIRFYTGKGVSLYFDEMMNLTSFDCSRPAGLNDDDMKYIVFFPETGAIHLSDRNITDAVFYYLQDLKKMKALSLTNTSVSGSGFRYITGNKNIVIFDFGGSPVTDTGISHISRINFSGNIIILNLKNSRITDMGLDYIAKMKLGQVRINLQGTGITDTGLKKIYRFKNAIEIDLRNTQVTSDGVTALKKEIPGADITWNESVQPGNER